MPGRLSRSSVPVAPAGKSFVRPKAAHKRKQRGLDAFSIAERQDPSRTKIQQHRLGESEIEEPYRKRQRVDNGDVDDFDQSRASAQRGVSRNHNESGEKDELDLSGGSDSEGNEWRMGEVGDDDDSDVDSDEAFGESDEERFEGFTFGRKAAGNGSKSRRSTATVKKPFKDMPLDEPDESDGDNENTDEDDLGDEAVDLAAVLDEPYEHENSDNDDANGAQAKEYGEDFAEFDQEDPNLLDATGEGDDASEDSSAEEESSYAMSEDGSEEDNQETRQQLKDMVASLSRSIGNDTEGPESGNQNPTLASALAALKESAGLHPEFEKQVQKLSRNLKPSKSDRRSNLVHAPLPKRQQDRIDRKIAYGKAKETLNRWIDTVKHNRRAEHLMFPLQDPHAQEPQGKSTMIPTGQSQPHTDLEKTIQGILEQSGLGGSTDQQEEDQIRGFEELQTNKMPLEEVAARRAELRKARELMFREEVRAKRIKKIKSKAYRRVHRKDAQKAAQKERDMLAAAGIDLSDDDKEVNDRRRAEARMNARHKESKWAKSIKQTGRAAWDDHARDGVTEMARRNEELRQRMEGKPARPEHDAGSDVSDEWEEEEDEDDMDDDPDGNGQRERLQRQLGKTMSIAPPGAEESKLASLKFMQRADATRKQQNDEAAESLRRELAGEESESDPDAAQNMPVGRRKYGPTPQATAKDQTPVEKHEFEEPEDSGDEPGEVENVADMRESTAGITASKDATPQQPPRQSRKRIGAGLGLAKAIPFVADDASKPSASSVPSQVGESAPTPPNTQGWTTIKYPAGESTEPQSDEDGEHSMSASHDPLVPSNLELVRSAFGGDDVEASFAAEKASAESSEDEKVTDNALPGWGSWIGDGISKRERKRIQERNKCRFVSKQEGVKPADRKDKGLNKVTISEKRSKKNAKYLASALPHPFESRQQYERTIRQPIGPEWATKESFQNSTKPRVLVRPGRRIEPMSTPML